MKFDKYILITGGAGFIGSHLLHKFVINYEKYFIINVDNLTYASKNLIIGGINSNAILDDIGPLGYCKL